MSSGHRDLPHVPHGPPSQSPGPGLYLMSEEAGVRVPEAGGHSRRWYGQAWRRWPPAPTTHPSPCCSRRRAAPVSPARKPRADRLCSESWTDSGEIGWEARAPPGGLGSRALPSAWPVGWGDRLPPAAQTWQNLPDGVLGLPLRGAHSLLTLPAAARGSPSVQRSLAGWVWRPDRPPRDCLCKVPGTRWRPGLGRRLSYGDVWQRAVTVSLIRVGSLCRGAQCRYFELNGSRGPCQTLTPAVLAHETPDSTVKPRMRLVSGKT